MTNPIVLIVGTRPEGIKMIPLYFAFKRLQIPIVLCSTDQHSDLLQEVYDLFGVVPDYQLDIMKPNQDLFYITEITLQKLKIFFNKVNPSLVLVQGDTTSSMSAALAAFYLNIPIGHVEAGLRTDDIKSPYPEEMNRRFISMVADYHFAPTALNVGNLLAEGINREKIFCTGNTVVDALRIIKEQILNQEITINEKIVSAVQQCKLENKKIVLLTVHRRESFNGGIVRILTAIKEFALANPDIFFFYPFHPNPNVLEAIDKVGIAKVPSLYLSRPVQYKELVYLLLHSDWVATDSGGIQEEAVSLGKQVLVLRDKTERIEGLWTELATLVGTNHDAIIKIMSQCLHQSNLQTKGSSIYGSGYAADMIAKIIHNKRYYGTVPASLNNCCYVVPSL
jgi:UDP-N-acetylglucosamine 2-epimerase (non-hydrolysing)